MLSHFARTTALVLVMLMSQATPLAQAQQQPNPYFPLSITDDSGTTTTFPATPRRIVSLNPGLTEITFALGAGNRLVAVDTFSDFPAEAKTVQPRLPPFPSVSVEPIVGLSRTWCSAWPTATR